MARGAELNAEFIHTCVNSSKDALQIPQNIATAGATFYTSSIYRVNGLCG